MSFSGCSHSPRPRPFLCAAFVVAVCLIQLLNEPVNAFQSVVPPTTTVPQPPAGRRSLMAVHAALQQLQNEEASSAGRRSLFRDAAAATVAGLAFTPTLAWAVEDLAMPTLEEQKKIDDDAMAERLRRKAELQKKTAKPATYKDSLSREMDKKTEMNSKTKEERRNAMCEELGRGC